MRRWKIRAVAAVLAGLVGLAACLFVLDASTLDMWLAFPLTAGFVFALDWGLDKAFDQGKDGPTS